MSFLSGIFLFGLPLLAVPVAIHLLNRRRQQVVKWAAMQFLMDSNIRRRKIWRLDDLIVMLLRTAAVLGIILALSRPMWHRAGPHGGLGRDVIFIWDVSMSMNRKVDGDRSSLDVMMDKSKDLLAQLGTRDSIRGMVTLGRGRWLTADAAAASAELKQKVLDEVRKIGVTQASADWITCLGTALRAAPPSDAKAKLIVLLSDQQAYGWRQQDSVAWQNVVRSVEESQIPVAIEMYNVSGVAPSPYNLAVDKLTASRQLFGIGETVPIEAEVHNHGESPVQQVTLNWSLDDVSIGKSSIGPIAPGQSRQVPFKTVLLKAGVSQLRCRLEVRDELENDNERALVIETVDDVPLLLVDDTTETDPLKSDKGYLLAALGHDPAGEVPSRGSDIFRVTTISSPEIAEASLFPYRAVIFANTPDLDEPAVAKLMEFVRSGGGLWMALGDRTAVEPFNRKIYRQGGGLSPWPIAEKTGDVIKRDDFLSIHPPEKDHPATVMLSDTQRLDIDKVKVFQRFPFAPTSATVNIPVLLRSGTGVALAIEGFLGRGRIFVQGIPLGVRWSNLPLMQAYVPLVHEWVWYLIQPTAISRNLQPGEPLTALLPANEHVREVLLKLPDGTSSKLGIQQKGDQHLVQTRETQQPGHYEVIVTSEGKDDQTIPYEVARLAEESNLVQWAPDLIARWTATPNLRLNPGSPLDLPSGTTGQRLGDPLWSVILAGVALAFLAEMWLVRRIAKKRFAGQTELSLGGASRPQTFRHPLGAKGTT
jgi:hypothetical protein